jgi:hypothetical protein
LPALLSDRASKDAQCDVPFIGCVALLFALAWPCFDSSLEITSWLFCIVVVFFHQRYRRLRTPDETRQPPEQPAGRNGYAPTWFSA